jgi:hypothetical protein
MQGVVDRAAFSGQRITCRSALELERLIAVAAAVRFALCKGCVAHLN